MTSRPSTSPITPPTSESGTPHIPHVIAFLAHARTAFSAYSGANPVQLSVPGRGHRSPRARPDGIAGGRRVDAPRDAAPDRLLHHGGPDILQSPRRLFARLVVARDQADGHAVGPGQRGVEPGLVPR